MDNKRLLNDTFDLSVRGADPFTIIRYEILDMLRTIEHIMNTIRHKIDDTTEDSIGLIGRRCGCLRRMLQRTKYSRLGIRDTIINYSDELDNIETMIDNIGEYCIRKRHGL